MCFSHFHRGKVQSIAGSFVLLTLIQSDTHLTKHACWNQRNIFFLSSMIYPNCIPKSIKYEYDAFEHNRLCLFPINWNHAYNSYACLSLNISLCIEYTIICSSLKHPIWFSIFLLFIYENITVINTLVVNLRCFVLMLESLVYIIYMYIIYACLQNTYRSIYMYLRWIRVPNLYVHLDNKTITHT